MGDRASGAGEGGWWDAAKRAYRRDVIERPVVGPVAGGVLGGFVLLLVWLTWAYAEGGDADQEIDGVYGLWTLAVVSLGALYAGWQPLLALARRRLTGGVVGLILAEVLEWEPGSRWPGVLQRLLEAPVSWAFTLAGVNLDPFLRQVSPTEGGRARAGWPQRVLWFVFFPLLTIGRLVALPLILVVDLAWDLASTVRLLGAVCGRIFSVIDFVLAQGVARLAGATLGERVANRFLGGVLRYAALLFWTIGGALVGWYAPAPFGAIAVVCGLLAVLGVARRWAWVETDRDAFMTARGAHPDMIRLGFKEDLRDEALTGLVLLFVLVPVGLRLVYGDGVNFKIQDGSSGENFLDWLTFFGVELLKALPLVDWSEVYEVENGSLINPTNAVGRVTVFLTRVSMDLLLLGSILQAAQVASRIAQQEAAFRANITKILDPFAEAQELSALGVEIFDVLQAEDRDRAIELRPSFVVEVARVVARSFPSYELTQLRRLLGLEEAVEAFSARGASELVQIGALGLLLAQQGLDEQKRAAEGLRDTPGMLGALTKGLLARLDRPGDSGAAGGAPVPELKSLAGGRFWMGSPFDEPGLFPWEGPRHERLIAPFAIGVYPVTFDEYDAFCEATERKKPADGGWGRGERPVINVTWYDAQAYLAWLCDVTGEPGWRLPSEAEWEYACRAGTETVYSFGDAAAQLGDYAWYDENSAGQTHPVGEKKPNAFGLYDMHGNVWEWCQDAWNYTYNGAPRDHSPWMVGDRSQAVLRGGSCFYGAQGLRSTLRSRNQRYVRSGSTGFRVARTAVA